MTLILQKWITRADLVANRDTLYVFGDNEERYGLGGQAREMRGEPNAVGIATLKAPGVFWTEDDAARQCDVIDADMEPIFQVLREGRSVVFPEDGVGSGLADLERRSPTTWAHLQNKIGVMKRLGGL